MIKERSTSRFSLSIKHKHVNHTRVHDQLVIQPKQSPNHIHPMVARKCDLGAAKVPKPGAWLWYKIVPVNCLLSLLLTASGHCAVYTKALFYAIKISVCISGCWIYILSGFVLVFSLMLWEVFIIFSFNAEEWVFFTHFQKLLKFQFSYLNDPIQVQMVYDINWSY